MAKDWNYAVLSKLAKEAGSPENLLDKIEEESKAVGYTEGQVSMVPWLFAATIGTTVITAGVMTLINHMKSKKAISQVAVEEAKAELIQGINEYNAMHPDENETGSPEKGDDDNEREIS